MESKDAWLEKMRTANALDAAAVPSAPVARDPYWTCRHGHYERDLNDPSVPLDKRKCLQEIDMALGAEKFGGYGPMLMRGAVPMDAIPDLTTYDGLELRQQNAMGLLSRLIGADKPQPMFARHTIGEIPDAPTRRHDPISPAQAKAISEMPDVGDGIYKSLDEKHRVEASADALRKSQG